MKKRPIYLLVIGIILFTGLISSCSLSEPHIKKPKTLFGAWYGVTTKDNKDSIITMFFYPDSTGAVMAVNKEQDSIKEIIGGRIDGKMIYRIYKDTNNIDSIVFTYADNTVKKYFEKKVFRFKDNNIFVNELGKKKNDTLHRATAEQLLDIYTIDADNHGYPGSYTSIEGSLSGLFSISESKKVRFSQGNLQYRASTNTWRFAENQYEFIGKDNKNISDTYNGWIDLFGWGTGLNPTLRYNSNEPENYYLGVDWGINPISNGCNKPNLWRTLTDEEWAYIIENSTYGFGNINDSITIKDSINGLFVIPDDWTKPNGISFSPTKIINISKSDSTCQLIIDSVDYSLNTYNAEEWTAMQASGVLFLPAAGYRKKPWRTNDIYSVNRINELGYYHNAVWVYTKDSLEQKFFDTSYGFSVRLVQIW